MRKEEETIWIIRYGTELKSFFGTLAEAKAEAERLYPDGGYVIA